MAAPRLPYPTSNEPGAMFSWATKLMQVLGRALDPDLLQTPGDMKVWPDTVAPKGWIIPAGQVLERSEYGSLYRAVSTRFNTGGETATQFRLPNPANPFTGGRWIIKT